MKEIEDAKEDLLATLKEYIKKNSPKKARESFRESLNANQSIKISEKQNDFNIIAEKSRRPETEVFYDAIEDDHIQFHDAKSDSDEELKISKSIYKKNSIIKVNCRIT